MQQIIVSDGFYSNPLQMKTLFSTMEYSKNENFLGGQICPMNFANDDMRHQMETITGAPQDAYEFVDGSGVFIINQASDLPLQTVCTNFPSLDTHWVGLVCLSESAEPHFLSFYKHNRTGWSGVPNSREALEDEGINTYEEFNQFVITESDDAEKWTETTRIELGFNKLILFRPGLFHSYSDVYGESKEEGRLLQFFFLKPRT